ncbi:hypothetical protein GE21DRAFT_1059602 [Neurospora crassa]|nr:hypothetical protein GE21DRAFT_1059602 [Neurospora crassa]
MMVGQRPRSLNRGIFPFAPTPYLYSFTFRLSAFLHPFCLKVEHRGTSIATSDFPMTMQSKTAPPSNSPDNLDGRIQSDDDEKTPNVRSHSVARKGQINRILLIAVAFLSLGWLTTLVFWYKSAPKPQDFYVSTLHQQYCQDLIHFHYSVDLDELRILKPEEEFKWRVLLQYCFRELGK